MCIFVNPASEQFWCLSCERPRKLQQPVAHADAAAVQGLQAPQTLEHYARFQALRLIGRS
jgi:hypothetical protein